MPAPGTEERIVFNIVILSKSFLKLILSIKFLASVLLMIIFLRLINKVNYIRNTQFIQNCLNNEKIKTKQKIILNVILSIFET